MIVLQNSTVITPFGKVPFQGTGGAEPYSYSVQSGGAGGSISASGVYTAPASINSDPRQNIDTIIVTDYLGEEETAQISILSPMGIMAEVIRREMSLATDQVYLYNQKYKIPEDSRLYVALGVLTSQPFGNTNKFTSSADQIQSINVRDLININIMSRSTDALNRKEEVLMALNSVFAYQMMNLCSIAFATISTQFVNLVRQEGSSMLYQFSITGSLQYFKKKISQVPYFDEFSAVQVTTNE